MTLSAFPGPSDRGGAAILGLGNILLSDEGVGVHAVNALRKRFTFSPLIDIIDGGTMGLDLLPLFQDRDRILIIDAVDFGKRPGYVAMLQGEAIDAVVSTKLSVHHIGLSDLLYASKLTRNVPPEVCLVGIQPQSLSIGLGMTALIESKLDDIFGLVINKLKEWKITPTAQTPTTAVPGIKSM